MADDKPAEPQLPDEVVEKLLRVIKADPRTKNDQPNPSKEDA